MLEAIIKVRPLSIPMDESENEDEQHILIESNGVSDFDIMQAAEMIVDMMRQRIVRTATNELIESGNLNPSKKDINDYLNSSFDTRNDINGLK